MKNLKALLIAKQIWPAVTIHTKIIPYDCGYLKYDDRIFAMRKWKTNAYRFRAEYDPVTDTLILRELTFFPFKKRFILNLKSLSRGRLALHNTPTLVDVPRTLASRNNMKAFLNLNVQCPDCNHTLTWESREIMTCHTHGCQFYLKQFERPSIELKEVVKEKIPNRPIAIW